MASYEERRKVLVLRNETSIRRLLTLMKEIEGGNGADRETLVAEVDRNQFDAAILDMRCSHWRSDEEVRGIREFRSSLVGKELVITAEVNGPKTLNLVERYLMNGLPQAALWLISHRYETSE